MKKYISPISQLIRLDLEGPVLGGSNSLNIDQGDDSYDASESYSNKKEGYWDNNIWSD